MLSKVKAYRQTDRHTDTQADATKAFAGGNNNIREIAQRDTSNIVIKSDIVLLDVSIISCHCDTLKTGGSLDRHF